MRKIFGQRQDSGPAVALVKPLITIILPVLAGTLAIIVTIAIALIPIYLPARDIGPVCPVNCNNSCTRLCLCRFATCNPSSRRITIVATNDRVPFISQSGTDAPVGFDVDLMNYIADLIGVKFIYEYKLFSQLISAVQNDINTISISTQTDTLAREAFVNFAQFFQTGIAFIIKSGSNLVINGLSDLCGKSVVVITSSIQMTEVQTQNALCGTNPIRIISVSTLTEATNLVANGIVQVGLNDEALLAYYASQSNGQVQVVGQVYSVAPYGILCNKQNEDLCCSLVNAINYLTQRGIYQNLFPKYSFNYKTNGICPSRLNLNGRTCASACVPSDSICRN